MVLTSSFANPKPFLKSVCFLTLLDASMTNTRLFVIYWGFGYSNATTVQLLRNYCAALPRQIASVPFQAPLSKHFLTAEPLRTNPVYIRMTQCLLCCIRCRIYVHLLVYPKWDSWYLKENWKRNVFSRQFTCCYTTSGPTLTDGLHDRLTDRTNGKIIIKKKYERKTP